MIRRFQALVLLISVAMMAPCIAQEKPHDSPLVDANTRFAFKLFRQTVIKTPEANVLMSPTALSIDFALLQNGAEPKAREQILTAFEFGNLSVDEINEQTLALHQALSYDSSPKPLPRARQGVQPPALCCTPPAEHLTLAGSLWTQPGVGFNSAFLDTDKKFYSFQTTSVPNRGPAAVSAVNGWITRQTGGALTRALDSWNQDDFLLVDTTWFKGAWIEPFLTAQTHPGDFTLLSGQKKRLPMMARGGHFSYFRGPKFQAVRLPYFHAAMYVFLPDEDSSLKDFEQSLTADNWSTWLSGLASHEGYLELPRFRSDYRADVTAILSDMGMEKAFTRFSSFAPLVQNPEGAKANPSFASDFPQSRRKRDRSRIRWNRRWGGWGNICRPTA